MFNESPISETDFTHFFGCLPSTQNALDLFKGEWSTRLPDACGLVASAGPARHCEDYRVTWAAERLGGFAGKRVIELGPLEGGHAYMLEQMDAREVVAIEANARAYLKCLILKEAFGLKRSHFLLGDFMEHLKATDEVFDVGFACGVLYHLTNPVELIALLARRCRSVFVWTHYYDPRFLAAAPEIAQYFGTGEKHVNERFSHTLYRKGYGAAPRWKGFCGGDKPASWLGREDIVGAFEYFGFKILDLATERNPNSPALLFVARR